MRQYSALFATAKWFSVVGVRDLAGIDRTFADGAGMLPGNLPFQAIQCYDWLARISIPPSILSHTSPLGRPILSTRFMDTVCDRLEMPMTDGLIPLDYGCDTWRYHTEGERAYLDNLIAWTLGDPPREANRMWYNQRTVTGDAMSCTQPIIPKDFRHMKRGNVPLFSSHSTVRTSHEIGHGVLHSISNARGSRDCEA